MNFIDEVLNSVNGLFEVYRDMEWVDVGSALPEGGTAGQVLTKTEDGADWSDIEALPEGGTAGQVLTKTEDGTEWSDIEALPEGGTAGQVLTKTEDGTEWSDIEALPEGGTAGQVLTKTEDGTEWSDIEALPEISASDANKVLTVTSDASGYAWIDSPGVSAQQLEVAVQTYIQANYENGNTKRY